MRNASNATTKIAVNPPRMNVTSFILVACTGCSTSNLQKAEPFGYRQLTNDAGQTGYPSLSRDGKFMVYTSDRASRENLDISVQALDRGTPVRVTDNPARDDE